MWLLDRRQFFSFVFAQTAWKTRAHLALSSRKMANVWARRTACMLISRQQVAVVSLIGILRLFFLPRTIRIHVRTVATTRPISACYPVLSPGYSRFSRSSDYSVFEQRGLASLQLQLLPGTGQDL